MGNLRDSDILLPDQAQNLKAHRRQRREIVGLGDLAENGTIQRLRHRPARLIALPRSVRPVERPATPKSPQFYTVRRFERHMGLGGVGTVVTSSKLRGTVARSPLS